MDSLAEGKKQHSILNSQSTKQTKYTYIILFPPHFILHGGTSELFKNGSSLSTVHKYLMIHDSISWLLKENHLSMIWKSNKCCLLLVSSLQTNYTGENVSPTFSINVQPGSEVLMKPIEILDFFYFFHWICEILWLCFNDIHHSARKYHISQIPSVFLSFFFSVLFLQVSYLSIICSIII